MRQVKAHLTWLHRCEAIQCTTRMLHLHCRSSPRRQFPYLPFLLNFLFVDRIALILARQHSWLIMVLANSSECWIRISIRDPSSEMCVSVTQSHQNIYQHYQPFHCRLAMNTRLSLEALMASRAGKTKAFLQMSESFGGLSSACNSQLPGCMLAAVHQVRKLP